MWRRDNGLLQIFNACHPLTKEAAHHNLLLWRRGVFQGQTGFAVEFANDTLHDDVKTFPDRADITVCQLQCRTLEVIYRGHF